MALRKGIATMCMNIRVARMSRIKYTRIGQRIDQQVLPASRTTSDEDEWTVTALSRSDWTPRYGLQTQLSQYVTVPIARL